MCYYYQVKASKIEIEERYAAEFENDFEYSHEKINGFSHPFTPIISDRAPTKVSLMEWGIIPHWAKDKSFQKNTLNCMIETANEKPSFKNCVGNRCLVVADSFYEWKHETINGKLVKTPFKISLPDDSIFSFAGIYNRWNNIDTFTILTTDANELMAEIHNSKKRMPVILNREEEALWLGGEALHNYAIRKEIELKAIQV